VNRLIRNMLNVAILSIGLVPFANAQQSTATAGKQPEVRRLAIKAGKLLDVRTGKTTSNAVLLVEDDRRSFILRKSGWNRPALSGFLPRGGMEFAKTDYKLAG
jgi:hypothetical protein